MPTVLVLRNVKQELLLSLLLYIVEDWVLLVVALQTLYRCRFSDVSNVAACICKHRERHIVNRWSIDAGNVRVSCRLRRKRRYYADVWQWWHVGRWAVWLW